MLIAVPTLVTKEPVVVGAVVVNMPASTSLRKYTEPTVRVAAPTTAIQSVDVRMPSVRIVPTAEESMLASETSPITPDVAFASARAKSTEFAAAI